MNKTFIWKIDEVDRLVSEDGYIAIYQRDELWVMNDALESDVVEYSSEKECLDEAGRRMLISQLGEFNAFLPMMEGNGELGLTHQIVDLDDPEPL